MNHSFLSGGFQSGSSKNEFCGADYWMERKIILVTFNYRLGPLGFLSMKNPSLKVPGNAGLKDQLLALKWIQRNIAKFGGDPQNVTIYGESAGAVSVHLHMLSDQSNGLFHKAIMVSGSAFDKSWSITDSNNDFAERLAKKCGWDGNGGEEKLLETLQKTDSHKLMKLSAAVNFLSDEEFSEFMIFTFTPVVESYESENCFIPKDPLKMAQNAWSKDIPCMIGAASLEGAMCNFLNRNAKYVELLQDSKFFTPSREMKINADKASKYGKIIRNIYFDEKEIISMKNVEKFLKYAGDRQIWHGVYNAIKSRSKCMNNKTFAFYFDADTEMNMMKRMAKLNVDGAAHADFGMYIFSR
jgi:cholinesterase